MYSKSEISDAIISSFNLQEQLLQNNIKGESVFDKLDDVMSNAVSPFFRYYYPYKLIFKLTSFCNLRCKHCFFYNKPEAYDCSDELSDEEKLEILKYMIEEVNIMYCSLTGGEIFLSPIVFDAIKMLKSRNIVVEILTNGTLITEDKAKKLGSLLNPDYDVVQVSLDGVTHETNDKIRGQGTYDKTINAIRYLKEQGLKVLVAYTINSQNIHEMTQMYEFCKMQKVDYLNYGVITPVDESHQGLMVEDEELFINTAKLAKVYDNSLAMRIKLRYLKPHLFIQNAVGRALYDEKIKSGIKLKEVLHCSPHHETVTIYPSGKMSLCYDCDREALLIGDLKQQPFDVIWANRFSKVLYKDRLLKNNPCKFCKYVHVCGTGCIYQAFEKYGTIDAPGVNCKYFNTILKENSVTFMEK